MKRRSRPGPFAAIVVTVAAVTGCSRGPEGPQEFTGTLSGFWHFEAQCAYLDVGEESFSLRVPEGFELRIEEGRPEASDVTIVAADGSVFASEGDDLRAVGTLTELPAAAPCGEPRLLRATELTAP